MKHLAGMAVGLLFALLTGCPENNVDPTNNPSNAVLPQTLKAAADFPIGMAVTVQRDSGQHSFLQDRDYRQRVSENSDVVVPINAMKIYRLWAAGPYAPLDFSTMDQFARVAGENGLGIHGHTYVWYKDTGKKNFWLRQYNSDWTWLLETYIRKVATHFKGRLVSVDVVNEAFYQPDEKASGSFVARPLEMNGWTNVDDYIARAFLVAASADALPDLYYNETGLAGHTELRKQVEALIDDLQSRQVKIDGVGLQMHVSDWPDIAEIRKALKDLSAKGIKIRISELDVRMNKKGGYTALDNTLAEAQAARYREIVRAYLDCVPQGLRGGITFWGVSDRDYHDPGCDREGEKCHQDWPRLFDNALQPKPAYFAVLEELTKGGDGVSCP